MHLSIHEAALDRHNLVTNLKLSKNMATELSTMPVKLTDEIGMLGGCCLPSPRSEMKMRGNTGGRRGKMKHRRKKRRNERRKNKRGEKGRKEKDIYIYI